MPRSGSSSEWTFRFKYAATCGNLDNAAAANTGEMKGRGEDVKVISMGLCALNFNFTSCGNLPFSQQRAGNGHIYIYMHMYMYLGKYVEKRRSELEPNGLSKWII